MKIGRRILIATLALIAAPFLAAAQQVSPDSTEPPPVANAPADATAATRGPLVKPSIGDVPGGQAEDAYDFDPRSAPGFAPTDRSDQRVPCANSPCSSELFRT
jgi:hypothetical protein